MTDYNKSLNWAQEWNNIICSSTPGTDINVMDVLAACVIISSSYLNCLPLEQKEQAVKLYLSNLQIFLLSTEGSVQ